ncbi:MAG TPA: ester cyclase [Gammaproteobacteria bacterium]|jgi:steroid delta-isomerase-like uncharacterized protein|nr:ester cyclase [Gammaproteobacteria bacterium]
MNALALATAYFKAWNARDAGAVVATFAESGTYSDPTTSGPLTGAAIGAYATSLWQAFPDLSFEIRSAAEAGVNKVVAEWLMSGTNTGSFAGLPPTGRKVSVPGVDVLETGADGVRAVTGYFDSGLVPKQLGLQVLVQPHALGPFAFGNSVTVQSGRKTKPGAFSITTIWNDSARDSEIREMSAATAREMLQMDGFIGLTLVRAGGRGITITAWEKPEDARQLMRSGAHRDAMARFWTELGDAAFTSVWTPAYFNPLWVRCRACGKMNDHAKVAGQCACGASLPDAPAFF